jgi:hypothetical protein
LFDRSFLLEKFPAHREIVERLSWN